MGVSSTIRPVDASRTTIRVGLPAAILTDANGPQGFVRMTDRRRRNRMARKFASSHATTQAGLGRSRPRGRSRFAYWMGVEGGGSEVPPPPPHPARMTAIRACETPATGSRRLLRPRCVLVVIPLVPRCQARRKPGIGAGTRTTQPHGNEVPVYLPGREVATPLPKGLLYSTGVPTLGTPAKLRSKADCTR